MTIVLKFRPKKDKKIPEKDIEKVVKELTSTFSKKSFLPNSGMDVEIHVYSDKSLAHVMLEAKGIYYIDIESENLIRNLIIESLSDTNSIFYVEMCTSHTPYNGVLFSHESHLPKRSENSQLLENLKIEIPDKYLCPLSGDIMDDPVYDVRTPNTQYDKNFLFFWLRKNYPQRMPETRLPYQKEFLKTDFSLKIEITSFVERKIKDALNQLKMQLLTKYEVANEFENARLPALNKALRRAAKFCIDDIDCKDIKNLIMFGANIDSQDENVLKKNTALHVAVISGNLGNAKTLLDSGAKVNIKNADGLTALELIYAMKNSQDREILLLICKIHGHIDTTGLSGPSGFFSRQSVSVVDQQPAVSLQTQANMNVMD